MDFQQFFLLVLLGCVLVLFIWGRWRYDVVAFGALLTVTLAGIIEPGKAFSGFGHPATVTVAMVLIVGRGLQNSGAVDLIARHLLPPLQSPVRHIGLLSTVAGALSAVMNNVGALALLMPAALQSAEKAKRTASHILMPLSFGSILGGLVTLIGTPPNIIIATFREELTGTPFTMFDFSPVGGVVALSGILFIAIVGWRLIPVGKKARLSPMELFDIETYVTETKVDKESQAVGKTLAELDDAAQEHDAEILAVIRRGQRLGGRRTVVKTGDFLVIEIGPEKLGGLLATLQLSPAGSRKSKKSRFFETGDTALNEALVAPGSRIIGLTGEALRLPRRFAVNLLGVARQGRPFRERLRSFKFKVGDVLLLEGDPDRLAEVVVSLGCMPLAGRGLQPPRHHLAWLSISLFATAVALATFGLVALPLALALAAGLMVVLNIVPPRDIYDSVDWPVIVLLGAMIPIGQAMETTGVTHLIAATILDLSTGFPPIFALTIVLVLTMTLSDIMNNAATAVVMAPVSANMAQQLGVNTDPFIMAVAIGASCAFLTPIGHQNNTLIMGPGGYSFGDYWRLGLPLEILIVAVSLPMLIWIWPL
jgi:di/tricarboxylate transporter